MYPDSNDLVPVLHQTEEHSFGAASPGTWTPSLPTLFSTPPSLYAPQHPAPLFTLTQSPLVCLYLFIRACRPASY